MRTNLTTETTLILPAAGYGTRVSADISAGKELLNDPQTDSPLIHWPLALGQRLGWRTLVISRKDKEELNEFITRAWPSAELLVLDKPGAEWPDTMLASREKWSKFNIMVLPDTRFNDPIEVLEAIRLGLVSDPIKFATFALGKDQLAKQFAIREAEYIAEKPLHGDTEAARAIGVFGFRRSAGEELFQIFSDKNNWTSTSLLGPDVRLEWFKDITRNGVVEGYDNDEHANNY